MVRCAYPGCASRFEPQSANQRYCEAHRVAHGRNRRAQVQQRQCAYPGCEGVFASNGVRKYCEFHAVRHRGNSMARRARTQAHELEFIGVDGEGQGAGKDHKYVLLGCGGEYVTWPKGLAKITDVFEFLYSQYEAHPGAVFVGFYLAYDFNAWLRCLPRERAAMLLTDWGRARRARHRDHLPPFPVEFKGWEFDILGYKRLKLRPAGVKASWMYINDAGAFFQTSLMNVIDPSRWPDGGVVTPAEYAQLREGKERRATAVLDESMIFYNALENDVLARVLSRLNRGFTDTGVRLDKRQWFGPGQASQKWMGLGGKLDAATAAVRDYPPGLSHALIASYYGGWFEIMAHGIVPGVSYEYDINNAYPFAISSLPCPCGGWEHGEGSPRRSRRLRLIRAHIKGADKVIGPMPYRAPDGRVLRPLETSGWYWEHELKAARRAGLVTEVTYFEWWEYATPCAHEAPLATVRELYERRLKVGKDSPEGKAQKTIANSIYGKIAQSIGAPRYGNALYASLITSACRTQILDAIATHPGRSQDVLMVATDAVYFRTPHPTLPVSRALGDWGAKEHQRLTLFKPGVYWNDASRAQIAAGEAITFKARGISARDFAASLGEVDAAFAAWGGAQAGEAPTWPAVTFRARFAQVSTVQALEWTVSKPELWRTMAGRVLENRTLTQSSDPSGKRDALSLHKDAHGVWRTDPWRHRAWPESTVYNRSFGWSEPEANYARYVTPDGSVLDHTRAALGVG